MAGNVALGSGDYYPNTGHNYYIYELSPGRFTMLPWDMNGSLEAHDPSLCSPMHAHLSGKLLQDPATKAKYFEILSKFLKSAGSVSELTARMDSAGKLLGSEISAEELKGLSEDAAARVDRLETELAATPTCD